MKAALVIALLLAGCASQPPRPVPPEYVRVAPSAALLEIEAEPVAPDADTSTQRDAARYLSELHEWAERGWARVLEIKAWSERPHGNGN